MSIHFYLFHSIPVRFFPISIYSYPFLSISINCIFLLVIQSKQNTMIRCSQPSHNAETKQHFESFRGILKCKPTHRGLFVVEQNEMEACFLEPPCQPAMAICQRKTTLQALKKQSSPLWLYYLSNGTACDTVLCASLRSPPELRHVAANSMHHGTCSFAWGPRTDSWAFYNLSTHKSYQTYILKTPQPPGSPTLKQHIQTIWYTYHQRMNENTGYTQWFWL